MSVNGDLMLKQIWGLIGLPIWMPYDNWASKSNHSNVTYVNGDLMLKQIWGLIALPIWMHWNNSVE